MSVRGEEHALFLQQLELFHLVEPAWRFLPVAQKSAHITIGGNHTVARYSWGQWIVPQSSTDGTWRGRKLLREYCVRSYGACWYTEEVCIYTLDFDSALEQKIG